MGDYSSFLSDKYLKDLVDSIDEYEVISFDVFDTLLFRTVCEPVDVFLTLGRHMQDEFPEFRDTPVEVLRQLRIEAQRCAQKKAQEKGLDDIPLEKIYDELHIWGELRDRIMELEMQAECDHIYANPHMLSFAHYCHEQGKKLSLTSDFYLSETMFRGLLEHAGIDCGIFSTILVSGEQGVTKGGGRLLMRLLDSFVGVPAEKVLHIGDNPWSDILPANKLGIRTLWYPVVPETKGIPFDMERVCYGSTLDALNSLRGLAMNTLPDEPCDEENLFWFREGCGIIGPVYALFAEWVVDTAVKENIKHILPFMREGELLADVIQRAAENRGVELDIRPTYVSRRATRLLSTSITVEDEVRFTFTCPQLQIVDLFASFYLDVDQTSFCEMRFMTVGECKTQGMFDEISEYLLRRDTITRIKKGINEQRELLSEYFRTLSEGAAAITVDLAGRGSIQSCVSRALKVSGNNQRLLHLLAFGHVTNVRFLIDNIEMRGWLGYGGEQSDIISSFYSNIAPLEALINANTGCTVRYSKTEAGIVPITSDFEFTEDEVQSKRLLWQGALCFQEYWFGLRRIKTYLYKQMIITKLSFLSVLTRLLLMPLYDEAKKIGELSFDDNVSSSKQVKIIEPEDLRTVIQFDGSGLWVVASNSNYRSVWWKSGTVALRYPQYYLTEYFRQKYVKFSADAVHYFNALSVWLAKTEGTCKVAVFGIGSRGRKLVELMWALGCPVDMVVDNSTRWHGGQIYGAKVMRPADSVDLVDTYIISSNLHATEMIAEVRKLHIGKRQPRIIYGGDLIE